MQIRIENNKYNLNCPNSAMSFKAYVSKKTSLLEICRHAADVEAGLAVSLPSKTRQRVIRFLNDSTRNSPPQELIVARAEMPFDSAFFLAKIPLQGSEGNVDDQKNAIAQLYQLASTRDGVFAQIYRNFFVKCLPKKVSLPELKALVEKLRAVLAKSGKKPTPPSLLNKAFLAFAHNENGGCLNAKEQPLVIKRLLACIQSPPPELTIARAEIASRTAFLYSKSTLSDPNATIKSKKAAIDQLLGLDTRASHRFGKLFSEFLKEDFPALIKSTPDKNTARQLADYAISKATPRGEKVTVESCHNHITLIQKLGYSDQHIDLLRLYTKEGKLYKNLQQTVENPTDLERLSRKSKEVIEQLEINPNY